MGGLIAALRMSDADSQQDGDSLGTFMCNDNYVHVHCILYTWVLMGNVLYYYCVCVCEHVCMRVCVHIFACV